MVESIDIILLDDKVPIRSIRKPFCKKCMNLCNEGVEFCEYCLQKPHPIERDWFFNRNVSLGVYNTYSNENYNKIPLNIISKMILTLKGNVEKPKKNTGIIISKGLFSMINKFPFLLSDKTYLVIPPKYKKQEVNQCMHFLKPFMKILDENGFIYDNISDKLRRIKDVGKSREKNRKQRFLDIRGVHQLKEMDLMGNNVLILDDVLTTASTIWDISRELKEKNAGEINVLTLGRNLIGNGNDMEADISKDMSIDELLIYFSNLDVILDPKKIDKVGLEDIYVDDLILKCRCKSYEIEIDFRNKVLYHNCTDFTRRRFRSKGFCKHITKLFLELKLKKGENFAREKLFSIYKSLLKWDFVNKH